MTFFSLPLRLKLAYFACQLMREEFESLEALLTALDNLTDAVAAEIEQYIEAQLLPPSVKLD